MLQSLSIIVLFYIEHSIVKFCRKNLMAHIRSYGTYIDQEVRLGFGLSPQ